MTSWPTTSRTSWGEAETRSTGRLLAAVLVGLAGTLVGAQMMVTGAVRVAESLDLSEGFVGMTVVALGTSLPELVTAISAARAGEEQLILGNILGSNLFNSLGVGAIVALAGPGPLDDTSLTVGGVAVMLAITALATAHMVRRRNVTRAEAVLLLLAYLACLPLLAA